MGASYIQVQITRPDAQNTRILPKSNILFDTVVSATDDTSLDAEKGTIELGVPGVYLAEWSISLDENQNTASIVFTADTTEDDSVSGSVIKTPGKAEGSIIFTIRTPGKVFLTNKQSPIILGRGSVMANLVIYSLDNTKNASGIYTKLSVPFSVGHGAIVCPGIDALGNLTQVAAISSRDTDFYSGSFYNVMGGKFFSIPDISDQERSLFSFNQDVTLTAGSAIFNNLDPVNYTSPLTHVSPYIAIAVRTMPETYNFEILEESRIYPEIGYQGSNPAITVLTATNTKLNVTIPAGISFTVVTGLISHNPTCEAGSYWIYMHGSMIFEVAK